MRTQELGKEPHTWLWTCFVPYFSRYHSSL